MMNTMATGWVDRHLAPKQIIWLSFMQVKHAQNIPPGSGPAGEGMLNLRMCALGWCLVGGTRNLMEQVEQPRILNLQFPEVHCYHQERMAGFTLVTTSGWCRKMDEPFHHGICQSKQRIPEQGVCD
ncbi:hypothetical protein KIL84_013850 [Mauremys mutica]|uniref:Uncharacterized protein n=1 Tax=Mauremys mutica TaxID=74926 RepID=A0A9D4AUR5_9SAUR|nr:hypothetical protein KIL84_013850 [Mauremys mutica]